MPKDPFKTRLEIAKNKAKFQRKISTIKDTIPHQLGTAFKLSTELVSAVAVGQLLGLFLTRPLVLNPG